MFIEKLCFKKKLQQNAFTTWTFNFRNHCLAKLAGFTLPDCFFSRTEKDGQYSLLAVVMFYEVSVNTKLVNTKTLLLEEIIGWVSASLWSQPFHPLINT